MARGLLDYFPDALAAVAHVSHVSNEQHNPGEEMHWAREKSTDHADCIIRHLADRGTLDDDGMKHSAKVAWRALALLQTECEKAGCNKTTVGGPTRSVAPFVDPRPGSHAPPWLRLRGEQEKLRRVTLEELGCRREVIDLILAGTSVPHRGKRNAECPTMYISGPMRGVEHFNFPAFDKARDTLCRQGFNVISPADIDRASGTVTPEEADTPACQAEFVYRDVMALMSLDPGTDCVVVLPGWSRSAGASAEVRLAKWLKLDVCLLGADGNLTTIGENALWPSTNH